MTDAPDEGPGAATTTPATAPAATPATPTATPVTHADALDRSPDGVDRPRQTFRADVAHTTATNLLIAGVNVATGALVARMLNPAGRGELAAILNWPTILGVLATLGLSESLVYFSARQPRRAGRYLGNGLLISLSASVVFVVIGWLAMPVLLAAQSDEVVSASRWYLLQVPVAAVLGLASRPLRGTGDVRGWNVLRTLPTLVWLVVVLAFGARGAKPEPGALALAFVLGRAALIPVTLVVVARRLHQWPRATLELTSPLLRFGLPSVLATLPTTLNVRLDQLLIAAFLPPGDLGLYAVAFSWSLLPSPVLAAFGAVLFPRVAETDDAAGRAGLAVRGVRVGIVLAAGLTAVTVVLTPIAIPLLFGHAFDVAVPTAMVLSIASGIVLLTGIQEEAVRGLGHPTAVLWAQLTGLCITVAALLLTIPTGKLFYIAWSSVAGYGMLAVVLTIELVRFTGQGLAAVVVPRRADVRAVMTQLRQLRRRAAGRDAGEPGGRQGAAGSEGGATGG